MNNLEEGTKLQLDYTKLKRIASNGSDVIPVAVQNSDTKEVILIAYVNEKSLHHTVTTGIATFWSTSRNELWIKGKTSGNTFKVDEILVNCEQNSFVFKVKPNHGGICHTKNKDGKARDCFYRRLNTDNMELENLDP